MPIGVQIRLASAIRMTTLPNVANPLRLASISSWRLKAAPAKAATLQTM